MAYQPGRQLYAHLLSLVAEGTFQKFPTLRFVLIEGGVSWLVPIMWRFDKNWKALRMTVPWLDRPPSEIVYEHVTLRRSRSKSRKTVATCINCWPCSR